MTAAWRSTVFLILAVLPLAAQDPKFADTTEVTAVEIPVQVLLDGKPVRGLTADSFAVFRDKDRQPITGFDTVDLATLPGERASEVPVPARRHFLMLFDLSFSEPKSILQARSAAKGLLGSLHPADLVAVATYVSSSGPELVLGFSSDRDQVTAAIDSLGLPQLVDRTPDPLRLILQDARQGSSEASDLVLEHSEAEPGVRPEIGAAQVARAVGDLAVLEQMERAERELDRADVETLKRKVSSLTRSFTDLAKFLRSVEGRKYVVYLSEGFDSSVLTGTRDKDEREESEHSGQAGRIWEVNPDQRFGHGSATNDVSAMLEEFRRADCIIQAVDIGGLRGIDAGSTGAGAVGFERTGGTDSLFQMARDTGGDLYENFNDLSAAMGTMLERTGVTYVLTIQPEQLPDGSYHTLRVETRGLPRGARVVHRPGYYAPKPFAQRSPTEKMFLTAGQVLAGTEGGLVRTSALAVPLPRTEASADVPVVVEIDGPSLLHLHEGSDVPVEIYVYAVDAKGQVGDYLAQTLALDLAKVETRLLQAGLKFYGHLELPPGSYKTRVLVRNGRTGAHGLRVVPIEVPAQAGPSGPVLLPPFFPEAKGQWLVLREAPREGRREVPVPFRLGDQPFLPAATPILDGGESRFALLGYNLADEGELRVRSQVLTSDGREVQAGDLSLVSRAPGEAGADRLELSFRPPALQPGEYLLRVTVTDAAGQAGTATTRFVVAAAGPGKRS